MEANVDTGTVTTKERHLPPMFRVGDILAPKAPQDVASAALEEGTLADLAVRLAFTVARFNTESLCKRLHLSLPLAAEVLDLLCREAMLEETLKVSATKSNYRITQRGREHASRLLDVCRYIGPAPVSLNAYSAMLRWQFASTPQVQPEHVTAALSGLVITPKAAQLAGLAVSSGRSMFVYGPPGNGKSSLGRQIHAALSGDYWIPYCISVGNSVIRVFDEQIHQIVDIPGERAGSIDQRWVRIRRPLVVVGGELTLELLELIYSPTMRYYEAPPHLKANGGVFLVDDFGRERISPEQLLNRFITPMEYQIDYFTLLTGQKIQLPLRHVLVIATNLDPARVTDPAFLRRMGYRLYLGSPTPEQYGQIFQAYAQRQGATVAPGVIDQLLKRYSEQKRELRCCEPRDICRFQSKSFELTPKVLDLAWTGYFGNELPGSEVTEDGNADGEGVKKGTENVRAEG